MKTKILLLSMVATVFSLGQVSAQEPVQTNMTVYQLPSVPVIDGVADAAWDNVPWYTLTNEQPIAVSASEFLVRVKLGWKGDFFYALIDRQDDTLTFDLAQATYKQDYIAFYINFDGYDAADGSFSTHPNAFYARTTFNPNVAAGGTGDTAVTDGHHGNDWNKTMNDFNTVAKVKYKVTGNNVMSEWRMETGIAGFSDGVTLIDGKELGFDLEIGDVDKNLIRETTTFWNNASDGTVYNDLTKIGIVTLSSAIANAVPTAVANNAISVYLSPLTSSLKFNTSATVTSASIINTVGQTVFSGKVSANELNVSQLNKGLFIVKAYDGTKLIGTSRIIKN